MLNATVGQCLHHNNDNFISPQFSIVISYSLQLIQHCNTYKQLEIHSVHENEVQGVQSRTGPRLMASLVALHFLIQNVQLHNPTLHFRICVGNECLQLPDIFDTWLTDYSILHEVLVQIPLILCGKFNSTCMTCTVLML